MTYGSRRIEIKIDGELAYSSIEHPTQKYEDFLLDWIGQHKDRNVPHILEVRDDYGLLYHLSSDSSMFRLYRDRLNRENNKI